MRGLSELVFSATNRCTARCQDCPIVHEGRPPRRLTLRLMKEIVDEVHSWGSLLLVVLTGGEPFLLGGDLRAIIGHAAAKGVATRIVTNAYWATSPQRALRLLGELRDAGLTEINISCDDYHQEFIPIERVRHANDAANALGLPALLGHRRKPGGTLTVESISAALGVPLSRFVREEPGPPSNAILSSPNVPLYSDAGLSERTPCEWRGPCDGVLKGIIIAPDARVQICCGIASNSIPELFVGSLAEERLLPILRRANDDLIVNWLALEGPSSILDFVRGIAPEIDLPAAYVNRCHLCHTLFTSPEVRHVLHEHAATHTFSVTMMRSVLDWISDEWAAGAAK
jgi:hypothetical protein